MKTAAIATAIMVASLAAVARADGVPVDLLASAPSTIAVSSTVANPKLPPAGLVDGNQGTAWSSRTGDLVGAWIELDVPASAHVTAIRMFAGFAHRENGQDWFTMNPRIKRVRVYHWGVKVGDHELDPDNRELQTLAVDGTGGNFRIEVLEIVPGTNRAWRETCVSELQVWGTLAPGVAPVASRPVVRVGSLDPRLAHDVDTVADLAKINAAWSSLATGARGGLAFPFAVEVHDVQNLAEPTCSRLSFKLADASATPDANDWHCFVAIVSRLEIPDHTSRVGGECCSWARETTSRSKRVYSTYIPVSAKDMVVTLTVGANGVSKIVLDLD